MNGRPIKKTGWSIRCELLTVALQDACQHDGLAQDGILKLSRSSDVESEFRIQFNQSKFSQLEADATASFLPTITIGNHPENG